MVKKQTPTKKKIPIHHRARRHAKQALVPHKGNQYRPRLIRPYGVAAVVIVALMAQFVYGFVSTGHAGVLGRASDVKIEELLADTNAERQIRGLNALQLDSQLSQAAELKIADMFANNYWAHTSPAGVTPWKWLADVGYVYSVAGENLAKNYPDADATVEAWMNSESHRANILDERYEDVGFAVGDGVLGGKDTTLIVAYYGTPQAEVEQEVVTQVQSAPGVSNGLDQPLQYFATALQSLSPVTIAVLGAFGVVALVGAVAHHYRSKLPRSWRKSWKQHHGMYTFWGMIGLGVLIILATGGGAI